MVYYLFWTAYSTEVDAGAFEQFFGVPLKKMYGMELRLAQWMGLVTRRDERYSMTLKGAFTTTTMKISIPWPISTRCGGC